MICECKNTEMKTSSFTRSVFLSPFFSRVRPNARTCVFQTIWTTVDVFIFMFCFFLLYWFVLFVFVTFVLYIGFRTEKRGVPVRNLCQSKGGNNVAGQSGSGLAAPVQVYRMAKEEDFCCCFSLFLRLFLSYERTVTYSPWQSWNCVKRSSKTSRRKNGYSTFRHSRLRFIVAILVVVVVVNIDVSLHL